MDLEKFIDENPEYKEKYNTLTDEEKQRLSEAAGSIERAIFITFEVVKQACERLKIIISQNRRVVFLALHSKKKRIRKKNMNRIAKLVKKRT